VAFTSIQHNGWGWGNGEECMKRSDSRDFKLKIIIFISYFLSFNLKLSLHVHNHGCDDRVPACSCWWREEDFGDHHEETIQLRYHFPNHILSFSKINVKTIHLIIFYLVAGMMYLLNQMQVNQSAHNIALLFNQHVSKCISVHFTTVTMIIRKESN
jgi:hypothetical protein